jgi:hypothetical protein
VVALTDIAGAGYGGNWRAAGNVLYNAHLNKNVHAFCENREYWQKGHSGLALGSSGTGARI